jgi:hypothetical protein
MNEEPYSGANPHPFENNTGEIFDHFWDQYRYLGKKHFWTNRWMYDEGCYWDEINPRDLWEVEKRCKREDEQYDYTYHGTWQEQEDLKDPSDMEEY